MCVIRKESQNVCVCVYVYVCVRHWTATATLGSINATLIGAPVVPVCSVISFRSRDAREHFRVSDFLTNLTRAASVQPRSLLVNRYVHVCVGVRARFVLATKYMKPSRKKVDSLAAKHFSLLAHRCTVARAVNGAQILGKDACPSLMEYR